MSPPDRVLMEGMTLVFRNFSGLPGRFNEKGDRNFGVIIDEAMAKTMKKDGWNIRELTKVKEDEPPDHMLKVNVKYWRRDGSPTRPPRVVLVSSKGKTPLDEGTLPILDWAELETVDLVIRPYEYEPGKYTAYANSIYATIRDDPLELKYWDVPDSAKSIVTEPAEGGDVPFA